MAAKQGSRDVSARAAVEMLKGSVSNQQIMEHFRITPQGFADLVKQLYEKKLVSEDDLARRGIKFKRAKKSEPPKPVPLAAPPPRPDDEEFVDTVTLTEMLSFGGMGGSKKEEAAKSEEIAPPAPAEDDDDQEKKAKFTLSGLFKKK